jgi:hypothetical protein
MAVVTDAESLTESPTRFDPVDLNSEWLVSIIASEKPWIRGARER